MTKFRRKINFNSEDKPANLRQIDELLTRKFVKLDEFIQNKFDGVYKKFDELEIWIKRGFDDVDERFDKIDLRFDGIDKRLHGMDSRIRSIDSRLDHMAGEYTTLEKHTKLEKRVKKLESTKV